MTVFRSVEDSVVRCTSVMRPVHSKRRCVCLTRFRPSVLLQSSDVHPEQMSSQYRLRHHVHGGCLIQIASSLPGCGLALSVPLEYLHQKRLTFFVDFVVFWYQFDTLATLSDRHRLESTQSLYVNIGSSSVSHRLDASVR